jgi:hypothetical protein
MTGLVTLSNGSEVSLPLVTDDALACFETFRVNASLLPKLPASLRPLKFPGKTYCVVMIADYRTMSIGPYQEMVVMSPVIYRGEARPPARTGFFVHEIAVTSEVSRLTGKEVWGFPKYLADIRFENTTGKIKASMKGPDTAFEISLPRWGLPLPAVAPLPIFTVKGGNLLLSYIKMKGILFLCPPGMARISLHTESSTLAVLGKSARALVSGFMKVSRATLAGPVFEQRLE